jgi:hypothetical protein
MRVTPTVIYYSNEMSFVLQLANDFSDINFIEMSHSQLMRRERSLYKKQLRKWVDAYNNNWVRGAVVVQAVVNAMPITELDTELH